ncbi:protocadherin gamma-A4-like [Protopterus annectens]|uniref:protocadherin gamma-A4-like n=1 Tax=Protopterus annectens TaxID=7888 RepID=UPI001CFA0EE0|nr:protocadherin gamma-A4-like [Protopterus annectens]
MSSAGIQGRRGVMHLLVLISLHSVYCLTSGRLRYSLPEESEHGSFVGHLAADVGIDPKDVATRRLRLTSSEKSHFFHFNSVTGDLYIKERIDREQLCEKMTLCVLTFEAVAENPLQVFTGEVEIQDINDNPPVFPTDVIKLSISELVSPGARFPLGHAVDPDIGKNTVIDYALSPTEYFSLILADREGSQYLELVLNRSLDHEKQSHHILVLTANDNGVPERTGTAQIQISVLDVNDNVPVFGQSAYRTSLKEGIPRGTLVVKVTALDKDGGSNGEVRYTFNKITDRARSLFNLDPITGEIVTVGDVDFEEVKMFEITIEAKDGGGLTAHCKVHIDIIDENDNAPQITISSVSNVISEDSAPGAVIAFINIVDRDSGENGETICQIQERTPFTLTPSFRNYYTLELNGSLDREEFAEYNITVTAIDKGFPPLSSVGTIYIKISDINDNPPLFSKVIYNAYITENNPQGYIILTVEAKDADWNQNAHVTYSIAPSYIGNSNTLVSAYVSINPDNGNIYALRSFDYEDCRGFQFLVQATDGGSPPLNTNVTVNVFIQDENDNIPKILYPLPSDEASAGIEIVPLLAEANYLVTKVVAVDADSGQNAWLSYQMLKAAENSLFSVGYHTGEIRTSRPVQVKEPTKEVISVLVKDNGQPTHSATAVVTIFIVDSFSDPLLDVISPAEKRDQDSNLTLYLLISVISVSALFFCFIIIIFIFRFQKWRQSSLVQSSFVDYKRGHHSYYGEAEPMGNDDHLRYLQEAFLTTDSRKNEFQIIRPYGPHRMGGKNTDGYRSELQLEDTSDGSNAVSQVRAFIN